jgi:hypothetical protein
MFLQWAANQNTAARLLQGHPEALTALIEGYWRNCAIAGSVDDAWPQPKIDRTLNEYGWQAPVVPPAPVVVPLAPVPEHLIYAYLIEQTGINRIFQEASRLYASGKDLPPQGAQSQRFWRATESLFFSDPPPTTIGNTARRPRSDEESQRMSLYKSVLGFDLTNTGEVAPTNLRPTPVESKVNLITTFETLIHEVWLGIVNATNTSGPNDTDDAKIAYAAQSMEHEMRTLQQRGELAREEFRAVTVMSWLHLAVSFDSLVVRDFRATASSDAERLAMIARQVGMTAHPKSKALFDIARPFSCLLRGIERGFFSHTRGARLLYRDRYWQGVARDVIGLYPEALGKVVKAIPVEITKPAGTVQRLPAPPRQVYPIMAPDIVKAAVEACRGALVSNV